MHEGFTGTPEPPYHAAIFTVHRKDGDDGYGAVFETMVRLAESQPGILGREIARNANGFAIHVSYWKDDASIRAWAALAPHRNAQSIGQQRWYHHYKMRVARVDRAYSGPEARHDPQRNRNACRLGQAQRDPTATSRARQRWVAQTLDPTYTLQDARRQGGTCLRGPGRAHSLSPRAGRGSG